MLYSYPADYDPATIASATNTEISHNFSICHKLKNIEPQQSYLTKSMD